MFSVQVLHRFSTEDINVLLYEMYGGSMSNADISASAFMLGISMEVDIDAITAAAPSQG